MSLLLRVLRDIEAARHLSPAEWDLLVRQCRHANLLGRLHLRLEAAGIPVPERARNHLLSGAIMAEQQHHSIRREVGHLRDSLAAIGLPVILLKGAAYVAAGLPAAAGRVFADVDILVPRARLDDAESALQLTGWQTTALDAYDQRYYRRWMHELPAMQHIFRGTALDVHHTILPPTSRLKPDAGLLIEASVEIPGLPGVRTLALPDLILHSASHLFHEGEPDNLLRDLTDLDALLRLLDGPAGWDALARRAAQLQLDGPLHLALRYSQRLLGTPVPAPLSAGLGGQAGGPRQGLLDAIYLRALETQHPSAADGLRGIARKALYIRAHWLRMPPHLLAYHLAHKALFPPKADTRNLTAGENPPA